jgi:hypothetical protein
MNTMMLRASRGSRGGSASRAELASEAASRHPAASRMDASAGRDILGGRGAGFWQLQAAQATMTINPNDPRDSCIRP